MVFINEIMAAAKHNPLAAGAMSLYGLTIITYLFKSVPSYALGLIIRHYTTSLSVNSNHELYDMLMSWLVKCGYTKNARTFQGGWDRDRNDITLRMGYGWHIIWYHSRPIKFILSKDSDNKTDRDKDIITLITVGRSRSLLDAIINDARDSDIKHTTTPVSVFTSYDSWEIKQRQPIRDFKSLYIPEKTKCHLKDIVDNFTKNENWYKDHGISYKTGIMLYGPPGTGKTSLIRALAGYTKRGLYILGQHTMVSVSLAVSVLPPNSILVIEDIDKILEKDASKDPISLGDLLNAIDGAMNAHDHILIITTNKASDLDPVLLRPGRIDHKILVDYVCDESFQAFLLAFFNMHTTAHVKPEVSIAQMQIDVMAGMTGKEIILKYCE